MKRLIFAALAISAGLHAATPTQSDLQDALAQAKAAWGVDVETGIVLESADRCGITADAKHPAGDSADINGTVAITSRIASTLTFDDGTTGATTYASVIHLNGACDWSDRGWLYRTVEHEYGHALGLQHSSNRHSIMFWMVYQASAEKLYGRQEITAADRRAISPLAVTVTFHGETMDADCYRIEERPCE